MKNCCILLLAIGILAGCSKPNPDLDENGALIATKLENTSGGGFDFSPMTDGGNTQADVAVYNYEGKPYTGAIVAYDEKKRKILDGNMTEGKANGKWTFYYPSGVVQIEGVYTNGLETGTWTNYYTVDEPKITKYYDAKGTMLMRTEFYNGKKVRNYQNIEAPEYGGIARRIQFTHDGQIEYIDAERELGKMDPKALNQLLMNDGLRTK